MAIACIPYGAYDSAGSTTTTSSNTTGAMAADLAANGFDALVLGNHSLYNHEYGHPNAFYPAIPTVPPAPPADRVTELLDRIEADLRELRALVG